LSEGQGTMTMRLAGLMMGLALVAAAQTAPLPQIRPHGAVKQLYVDNRAFVMLAGELHNSSASSVEYMKPIWDKLALMHLNTVIGTASWELVEPQEGKYDFALVDAQIQSARQRNMRLVLIWFATWALGRHAAWGWSPFGVEDLSVDGQVAARSEAGRAVEWCPEGGPRFAILHAGFTELARPVDRGVHGP
jgi:hypothetical protein